MTELAQKHPVRELLALIGGLALSVPARAECGDYVMLHAPSARHGPLAPDDFPHPSAPCQNCTRHEPIAPPPPAPVSPSGSDCLWFQDCSSVEMGMAAHRGDRGRCRKILRSDRLLRPPRR